MRPAKSLTAAQAAKAGRCAKTTIVRLIKAGKLKGDQTPAEGTTRKVWFVHHDRAEVREIVDANVTSHGFKWASTKAKAREQKTNGHVNAALADIAKWAALAPVTRATLMEMAEKRTQSELELLLSL